MLVEKFSLSNLARITTEFVGDNLINHKVRKVVLPAAGLGTRLLPVTKALPKEMLPLVDKPMIQYVVEEALSAGLTDIIIITGRNKRAMEDYFDKSIELNNYLSNRKLRDSEKSMMEELERICSNASIYYVRQKEPLGLGHAISCASEHIGEEPFAVMLADDIFVSKKPVIQQMKEKFESLKGSVLSVKQVLREDVPRYGIISSEPFGNDLRITDIIEKPSVETAKSNIATFGRYVFTPELLNQLIECPPGKNGEIQLADGIKNLLGKQTVYGSFFEGERYDGGDKLSWLESNVKLALLHPKFKNKFSAFIKSIANQP